ncbi:hypothetical protein KP509_02G091600 [Ceratopteris richardii]|uniref:DNA (cytosine-5-)-methyltransferase n=1 Tax=Ceratopteris richardii TaxID=49495 RepID=A0A8T2VFV0_CERRI|nr:hypothetical protein KP509_02G091600 [Ceratopteris richardii]
MDPLLNCESSSSSANSSESKCQMKDQTRNLDRFLERQTLEVSVGSSAVDVDQSFPNHDNSTTQSDTNPATILIEMGCSFDKVVRAISLCGKQSRIEDLFDFIQACDHPLNEERPDFIVGREEIEHKQRLSDPCSDEEVRKLMQQSPLLSQTYSAGCKGKGKSVMQMDAFTEDAEFSMGPDAVDAERSFPKPNKSITQSDMNPATILIEMGCSFDKAVRAINLCGKESRIEDLFDFIQACDYPLDEEKTSCTVGREDINEHKQKLSDACSDEEVNKLMQQSPLLSQTYSGGCKDKGKSAMQMDIFTEYANCSASPRVDSPDNEESAKGITLTLQSMGFSSQSIGNAIKLFGTDDFEQILNALISHCEDEEKRVVDSVPERIHKYMPNKAKIEEPFSTREAQILTKWTCDMEKLWCSYMGKKKRKVSSSPLRSDDSDSDILESNWEESPTTSKANTQKMGYQKFKDNEKLKLRLGKMMGYGIPGCFIGRPKPLPEVMCGPPYFYFENVAGVPNNEWDTIKRHFNGVDPEFTDSKYFSASCRPRGYVHNLPLQGRSPLPCVVPMSIAEAFPDTQKYWPSWDTREKLNCISTRKAPDSLCGLIRKLFTLHGDEDMPYYRQKEILQACRKWNLVWVGPGQAAPLEPHEIELLLGFDKDHTRGCASMTERYDALGNSFQINTVAYHLSTLKPLYPHGITVLSLFSGIGGGEVSLHKLGIYLKVVIAVEINEKVRGVLKSWWRKSCQAGELKLKNDVRDLTHEVLTDLIDEVGPIDLIIGGSPCNNLSGNNRVSRTGLNGSESSLFFEFPRILNIVTQIMRDKGFL